MDIIMYYLLPNTIGLKLKINCICNIMDQQIYSPSFVEEGLSF